MTLTPEERHLLANNAEADPPPQAARRPARKTTASGIGGSQERGQLTPAQYDDDGWGNTPVQMRG